MDPGNQLAEGARDYLRRKKLTSPLRQAEMIDQGKL
jgi:hypothetical protein